ncbi:hypothetical protein ADUPG1_000658, partial [Aduncisulcus paluster]
SSLKELNLTNGAIISTNSVSVPLWMQEMKSLTPLFDVDNNYDVFSSSGGLFPPTLESISIAGRVNVSFPSFFESLILDGGDPLPHLTTVNLSGTNVYDFSSLPASVTNLIVNEGSNVHGTPHFRDYATLPSSLTSLSLQNNINDLSVLPAHVPSLQYLDLSRSSEVDFFCQSITLFAIDIDSITKLTDLESLDLSNCGLSNDSLSKLADMPQLKELYINNTCENVCNSETYDYLKCQDVSDISSLSTLTNLTHLGLHGLGSLDDISIIPTSFPALEFLDIGHIQEQISIPDMTNLTNLKYLDISGLTNIENSLALFSPANLEVLIMNGCREYGDYTKTDFLLGLDSATNLIKLDLGSNDFEYVTWPDFTQLTNLEWLSFNDCSRSYFPDQLWVSISIPDMTNLTNLKYLDISGLTNIENSLALFSPANLEVLIMNGCREYGDYTKTDFLLGLDSATNLIKLDLGSNDFEYVTWPDFTQLTNLEWLSFNDCSRSYFPDQLWVSVGSLVSLKYLDMPVVESKLDMLSDFSIFPKLRVIQLTGGNVYMNKSVLQAPLSTERFALYYTYFDYVIFSLIDSLSKIKEVDLACYDLQILMNNVKDFSGLTSAKYLRFNGYGEGGLDLTDVIWPKSVRIFELTSIRDFGTDLSLFTNLEQVVLGQSGLSVDVNVLSPFISLNTLKKVTISDTFVSAGIEVLGSIKSLERLDLANETCFVDQPQTDVFEGLTNLHYLRWSGLECYRTEYFYEIDFSSLVNLQQLISYKGRLDDYSELLQVRYIDISLDTNNDYPSDVSQLRDLNELCILYVRNYSFFYDLSPMYHLPHLRGVYFGGSYVCFGNQNIDDLQDQFVNSRNVSLEIPEPECTCPSLDPEEGSTIAVFSDNIVCKRGHVTCSGDSYATYTNNTLTCTKAAGCADGCNSTQSCVWNEELHAASCQCVDSYVGTMCRFYCYSSYCGHGHCTTFFNEDNEEEVTCACDWWWETKTDYHKCDNISNNGIFVIVCSSVIVFLIIVFIIIVKLILPKYRERKKYKRFQSIDVSEKTQIVMTQPIFGDDILIKEE